MSSSSAAHPTSTTRPRGALLVAGIVGPAVFLSAMLLGIVGGRTSGSAAASGLEVGQLGWLMSMVFIVTGACILAFTVGQYRALKPASRVGTALLGIAGLAVLLSGVFVPDATRGAQSAHDQLHNMLFLVMMLFLALSFPFNGVKLRRNGFRGGLGHSIASTVVLPILVIVFGTVASDPGDPLYSIGGFVLFAIIAVAFGWVAINAARLLRASQASDN